MTFDDKCLKINDKLQWERISMKERIKYRMPATTNAIESTHGHLNAKLPRRNEFWLSLYRLVESTTSKDLNFNARFRANYNRIKRITFRRLNETNRNLLESESMFFSTTEHSCNCGETTLESSMLRIDLPCSHRLLKNAEYPDLPDVDFKLKLSSYESRCKYKLATINFDINQLEHDESASLQSDAVRNNVKFGKAKKADVIKYD